MRLKKLQIGAVILASFAGGVAPVTAQAATSNPTVGNTITVNYESNIKNMLYDINSTVDAINVMVEKGLVTNDILTALSEQLMQLSTVIGVEGASEDVLTTLTNVKNVFKNVVKTEENAKGYNRVETALNIVDTLKNINTPTSTPVQTPTEKTLSETAPIVDAAKATTKKTYATKFTDVTSKTTNYKYIKYLTDAGALGGYKDGKFKPATKMTNSKYICILVRAIDPKAPRATKGNDYDVKTMNYAAKIGLFKENELAAKDYGKVLTKQDMALWAARAMEIKSGKKNVEISDVSNLISDYSKIDSKYKNAVKDVYSAGIISSSKFSPTSTVTRSTASVVIARVAKASYRKDMSKVDIPTSSESADKGAYKGQVVKYNDANRGLVHDGMVWQNKAGKKITIKSLFIGEGNWKIEIPGYGQGKTFGGKVDFYTGMRMGDTTDTLKEGMTGTIWNGDDTYMAQKLYSAKSPKDGATYVYFSEQWKALRDYEYGKTYSIKNPKDGDVSSYFYVYSAKYQDWVWQGPNF